MFEQRLKKFDFDRDIDESQILVGLKSGDYNVKILFDLPIKFANNYDNCNISMYLFQSKNPNIKELFVFDYNNKKIKKRTTFYKNNNHFFKIIYGYNNVGIKSGYGYEIIMDDVFHAYKRATQKEILIGKIFFNSYKNIDSVLVDNKIVYNKNVVEAWHNWKKLVKENDTNETEVNISTSEIECIEITNETYYEILEKIDKANEDEDYDLAYNLEEALIAKENETAEIKIKEYCNEYNLNYIELIDYWSEYSESISPEKIEKINNWSCSYLDSKDEILLFYEYYQKIKKIEIKHEKLLAKYKGFSLDLSQYDINFYDISTLSKDENIVLNSAVEFFRELYLKKEKNFIDVRERLITTSNYFIPIFQLFDNNIECEDEIIIENDAVGFISQNYSNNCKEVINLDTNTKFESIASASKFYGISQNQISKVCNGKAITAGGFHFSFVNNENNQIK